MVRLCSTILLLSALLSAGAFQHVRLPQGAALSGRHFSRICPLRAASDTPPPSSEEEDANEENDPRGAEFDLSASISDSSLSSASGKSSMEEDLIKQLRERSQALEKLKKKDAENYRARLKSDEQAKRNFNRKPFSQRKEVKGGGTGAVGGQNRGSWDQGGARKPKTPNNIFGGGGGAAPRKEAPGEGKAIGGQNRGSWGKGGARKSKPTPDIFGGATTGGGGGGMFDRGGQQPNRPKVNRWELRNKSAPPPSRAASPPARSKFTGRAAAPAGANAGATRSWSGGGGGGPGSVKSGMMKNEMNLVSAASSETTILLTGALIFGCLVVALTVGMNGGITDGSERVVLEDIGGSAAVSSAADTLAAMKEAVSEVITTGQESTGGGVEDGIWL
eukprot:CAMPEP_0194302678 /NCGR_PEP_ID=MMETSP0171-20130528/538_1 /TAXON_ID=218684 /ORGANISM="Corethron pennatum, Strain L29A3" /LENGTH=389 /DNA_ID=CAMNT_0039053257 /DNA_START=33 /DNA_END=1202 /DNA_ORIENTATION=-